MRIRIAGLSVELIKVTELTPQQNEEIWQFASQYTHSDKEGFFASLHQKRDAVLMRRKKDGPLLGIGGVLTFRLKCGDEERIVLFPGDALFDPAIRGKNLIEKIGFLYYLEALYRYRGIPIYTAFGTFSYKSYRVLRRSYDTFWPRYDCPIPPEELTFLQEVALRTYGNCLRISSEAVVSRATKALHDHVAPIDEALLTDPDIRFFQKHLPDYGEGSVLLCVVPLTWENWRSTVRKIWERQLHLQKKRLRSIAPIRT